ncbi:MAG TPA: hypothetical protein V6C69_06575 [Trichormus sp.]|jgi:hypothetical protein
MDLQPTAALRNRRNLRRLDNRVEEFLEGARRPVFVVARTGACNAPVRNPDQRPGAAGRILLILAALCLLFTLGAPVHAAPIQLEAQHDEALAPLPPQFQAGAEVEEAAPIQHIEWFPIPSWMAGTWAKQGDYEDSAVNLQTGQQLGSPVFIRNADSLSFGDQCDNKGTVWHAEILPFRSDGYNGKTEDRRYVTQMRCVTNSAQEVVLQVRSFVTSIDPKKHKVRGSKQQDEFITFQPLDAQQIQTTSSTRSYSGTGQPLMQSKSHTTRTRAAAFVPVPTINGIDLRRSLADYLAQHNWAYLIPQQGGN